MASNIKKILTLTFSVWALTFNLSSFAVDFIVPNSGGEPVIIDVSNLDTTSTIDVTVAGFGGQPRPYRDSSTKNLVFFPLPANSSSEQTIEVRSGNSKVTKTISFRSAPQGNLKSYLLPSINTARGGNTATKISDGRVVLIGGGKGIVDSPINSVEIFDPETGRTESLKNISGLITAKLKMPRSAHTATYLGISESPLGMISGPVEQILLAGGFSSNNSIEDSLEILEIKVGTNQGISTVLTGKKTKLKKPRIFHTANLLPDGRVIFIGGQGPVTKGNFGALNSIEIFDPAIRKMVTSNISLNTPRILHTATALQDGNILIAGGFTNDTSASFGFGKAVETCELIDTGNLNIKKVGSFINNIGVGGHSASLLSNGLVFISGGSTDFFNAVSGDEPKGVTKEILQIYNPSSETFSAVVNKAGETLSLQKSRFLHSSILLPNGNIAIIGGLNIKQINAKQLSSIPVSLIEVFSPDLLSFSNTTLKTEQKTSLDTFNGRVFPTAILVTPKLKTKGFFTSSDTASYINSGIFLTGGFTDGLGKLPSKLSEFIHIVSTSGIEGREITLNPPALLMGGYISEQNLDLDIFSKVPSLLVSPQTVNLSNSNSFSQNVKITTSNNQNAFLTAVSPSSIVITPTTFQAGETISITRKDSSVSGEFDVEISSAQDNVSLIPLKLKVNVSDTSKFFLSSSPAGGISVSNEQGTSSETVTLKVLSGDGATEISSILSSTEVTAIISDPTVANLGGTGISSVVGNLTTQFMIIGVKPGRTSVNFLINSSDVLSLSLPVEVSGTPSFTSSPIDPSVLTSLVSDGISPSSVSRFSSTSVILQDVRLSNDSAIFPYYIPVNLTSSVDSSNITGTFTLSPAYGVDLFTSVPRTFTNPLKTNFKTNITEEPSAVAGIIPTNSSLPTAFLSFSDSLKSAVFESDTSIPINQPLSKLNNISGAKDLKSFEFESGGNVKVVVLKENMISLIDTDTKNNEVSASLSDNGFELELTKISNQDAAVVSVGNRGIDLVYPITESNSRLINFKLPGNTEHITIAEKLSNINGPFAIAYDGSSTISIINLLSVDESIQTIEVGDKILKIDYAGRFNVNGQLSDVLFAQGERELFLYDLNNKTSIPVTDSLKIKTKIEDSLVVDGIAYLALGTGGIKAVSIGALLGSDSITPEITTFKENKLIVVNSNGSEEIKTKPINAKKLAVAKPFLLSSGSGNPLTVIRIVP